MTKLAGWTLLTALAVISGCATDHPFGRGEQPVLESVSLPANVNVLLGSDPLISVVLESSDGTVNTTAQLEGCAKASCWSTTNPAVATVDPDGRIRTHGTGQTTVTFTYAGVISNQATIEVFLGTALSVRVAPGVGYVFADSSLQMAAEATLEGGDTADVTGIVVWSTSSDTLGTITVGGLLTVSSVSSGSGEQMIVRATLDGKSGTDTLQVTTVRFSTDVMAVLSNISLIQEASIGDGQPKACTNTECHGAVNGEGGDVLLMTVDNPQAIYNSLTAPAEINPYIDLVDPIASYIFQKTLFVGGQTPVAHDGGGHFANNSDDAAFMTLKTWVLEQALFH